MRLRVLAVALPLVVLPAERAAGEGVARPTLPGVRPLGMGNAFVAVVDDRNALHYNPAGLAALERLRFSGAGVTAGVDHRFFDVMSFIQENEGQFVDFETIDPDFYDRLAPYDDRWTALDASAYFDATGPGFGAGTFTVGRLQFKADRGVYEPRVSVDVYDDIVLLGGAARSFVGESLHAGATLKAVWRREASRDLTALEVAGFDPQTMLDDLESARGGLSTDVGFLWRPAGSTWSAGAVFRDLVGAIGGEDIDTALDLGVAWRPIRDGRLVRSVTLAADRRNLFGGEPFGVGMNVGGEVQLPVVSGRLGFHQGYPTLGLTLESGFFALDYAWFGRELGELPGAEAQFLHALEARFGF